jgi:hypothetical protein
MGHKSSLSSSDDDRKEEQTDPDGQGESHGGNGQELTGAGDVSFNPEVLDAEASHEPPARDPYDPEFLGLSQDFAAAAHVDKVWHTIKVDKPPRSQAFRVHPDPRFRLKTTLLLLKEDSEAYLVLPRLREFLADEPLCGVFTLFACVTKAGTPFLWPIKMADADGKWNVWHQSAWKIAERAQQRWVRMTANRLAGYYDASEDRRPPEQQQAPAWPELAFPDWLRLAFQGYTIDSPDHPVLKRLRLED